MDVERQGNRHLSTLTTGERIRLRRESRGMSRPVLAGLVGRSADWLKKIETGVRPLNSLTLLVDLARVLEVDDLPTITGGDFDAPVNAWATEIHHVVPAIRNTMNEVSFDMLARDSAEPNFGAEELRHRVADLWKVWHGSPMQRSTVGPALPALIRQAHASVRSTDGMSRRLCRAATADLYRLVQRLLAHISEPELHALAVERGRFFSEEADTPGSLAEAAWASAVGLCAAGHHHDAARLAERGVEALLKAQGDRLTVSAMGTLGALQLEAAAAHGLAGSEGEALRCLDAAARTADHMPPSALHLPSAFDRSNVEIMAVIVDTALHHDNEALRRARQIDLSGIRSVVRRSRLLLECAQTQANRRKFRDAARSLRAAAHTSPEAVALIPWTRGLVDDLTDHLSGEDRVAAEHLARTLKAVH